MSEEGGGKQDEEEGEEEVGGAGGGRESRHNGRRARERGGRISIWLRGALGISMRWPDGWQAQAELSAGKTCALKRRCRETKVVRPTAASCT
eukprot:413419-Pyramimonas_sp.AAC.2